MKNEVYCTQCGEDCNEFVEGYCKDCTDQNYKELNDFQRSLVWWDSLTNKEREFEIAKGIKA